MIDLSRRRILLLGSLATPWLLGGIRPSSGGWLEQWFSWRASTLTSPITPNEEFYLTSYRSPPTVRIHEWSLSVRGLVERPMTLDYEQLCARPSVSHVVTLECVGNTVAGEYIGTARWEGCSLRSLLEEAGVRTDAVDVVFRAADEYSDSISLTRAMAGDVMVAFRMNGVALPQSHGFPARMIVPGHYGMKSVQWLTDIEAVDHDYKGYYARKGWIRRGDHQDHLTHRCPRTRVNSHRVASQGGRPCLCRYERNLCGRGPNRRGRLMDQCHARSAGIHGILGLLAL